MRWKDEVVREPTVSVEEVPGRGRSHGDWRNVIVLIPVRSALVLAPSLPVVMASLMVHL